MSAPLTIRLAHAADRDALRRLAQLDSARVPAGRLLLAEVDGELWAAASIDTADGVADPFRRSGEVLALLRERARQLERASRVRSPGRLRAVVSRRVA